MIETMIFGLLKLFIYSAGLLLLFGVGCSLMLGRRSASSRSMRSVCDAVTAAADSLYCVCGEIGYVLARPAPPQHRKMVRRVVQVMLAATIIGGTLYAAGISGTLL